MLRAFIFKCHLYSIHTDRHQLSSNSYVQPFLAARATHRALIQLGRAITASALVAAWDRGVRLGVDEANDARRLTTDGGLGNRSPAGVKLRGGERHHGQRR